MDNIPTKETEPRMKLPDSLQIGSSPA